MNILFCGGGTAGHIMPAIAIAESFKKHDRNTKLLFVGREGGSENRAITNKGYPLKTLRISGIERRLTVRNIKNIFTALHSLKEAEKIIKDFSPDAVIGTGGYVSWPIITKAHKLGIPTAIHESNASAGLVTQLLSKKCDILFLNMQGSENEYKGCKNIKIVGNPVREEFGRLTYRSAREKIGIRDGEFFILSLGGSGGSEKINGAVIALMKKHTLKGPKIKHIHSCGIKYFDEIKTKYPSLARGINGCVIKPYIDDIEKMLAAADIVIARSGAMTLSELAAVGAAAILIPSPNVTNNHQYKNARLLADSKACILLEEKDLSEGALLDTVLSLEKNDSERIKLRQNIKSFYIKNSSDKIREDILNLIKTNSATK